MIFLRNALKLIDEGEDDLAVFNLEQYCQLILKYKLLVIRGVYPQTHSLRRLIRELGSFDSRILVLINYVKNLHYVARLKEAHITSRYLPYEYTIVLEVFKSLVEGDSIIMYSTRGFMCLDQLLEVSILL